jgi:hypothetical protein
MQFSRFGRGIQDHHELPSEYLSSPPMGHVFEVRRETDFPSHLSRVHPNLQIQVRGLVNGGHCFGAYWAFRLHHFHPRYQCSRLSGNDALAESVIYGQWCTGTLRCFDSSFPCGPESNILFPVIAITTEKVSRPLSLRSSELMPKLRQVGRPRVSVSICLRTYSRSGV